MIMKMVDCPKCDGGKKPWIHFPAFPNAEMRKSLKGKTEKQILSMFPCLQCGGQGKIPELMLSWMADGEKLKEKRLSAKMTLRKAAKYLNIHVAVLSDMERGRILPDMEINYEDN